MKYYIQNTEAGFLGNAIIFWAKDSRGYTADLNNSEQFTEEEAKKICLGNPEKNKAWPVDYIDNCKGIQRVTDLQYLSPINIRNWNVKLSQSTVSSSLQQTEKLPGLIDDQDANQSERYEDCD